jgi:hypothetical protein
MLKPTGPKDARGSFSNNYTKSRSPNDPIEGTKLLGVDQAAMQAKDRLHEEHERMEHAGPFTPMPTDSFDQHRHDYKAIRTMEKRKDRGGQTFKKHDTMGCD